MLPFLGGGYFGYTYTRYWNGCGSTPKPQPFSYIFEDYGSFVEDDDMPYDPDLRGAAAFTLSVGLYLIVIVVLTIRRCRVLERKKEEIAQKARDQYVRGRTAGTEFTQC